MFGWQKKRDEPHSILDTGTEIEGPLKSRGFMEVCGRVVGDIHHEGNLVIAAGGCCLGQIEASQLTIAGEVIGDVVVAEKLQIRQGGKLVGDATCGRLCIDAGGTFEGHNRMGESAEPAPEEPLAILMAPLDTPQPPVDPSPSPAEEPLVAAMDEAPSVPEEPVVAAMDEAPSVLEEPLVAAMDEAPSDPEEPLVAAMDEAPSDPEEPTSRDVGVTFHGFLRPKRSLAPRTSD